MAPAGLLYRPRCPARDCGANVERFRAAYGRRAVGGKLAYFAHCLPARVLARTAVDRRSGGAAYDGVYSVPVIAEAGPDPADPNGPLRPTVLSSEVLVPDGADAALVAEALTRIEHLGGGASRGLGAVQVQVSDAPPPEPLAARLERFARALALRRTQYARLAPLSAASLEGAFFSVDLRSDALLRRHDWEPTPVLDADLLRVATGVNDASLALVRAYAEPGWRGGWHAAWGLPTPSELVASRGSSYLFRTNNLAAWTDALEALELAGIGERTTEGFGQIVVCDPFHLVLREQAV
jgi:CRISPR-associated protein Csx10